MSTKDSMQQDNERDTDDVLIAFAQATTAGTAGVLADWVRRYPAQAKDLAHMAAAQWGGETTHTETVDTAAVARVRDLGLATIRARRGTVAVGITSLVAVAAARGMDAEAVAAKLDIPFALFFKLHRRLIALESIPQKFLTALADTLGRQIEDVTAYLRQPPTLAAGAVYRADDKPTVGEAEWFADALRDDPEATPGQKARWLA